MLLALFPVMLKPECEAKWINYKPKAWEMGLDAASPGFYVITLVGLRL